MLIYTVNRKPVKFIHRAHPFSITPGQVIVDCYQVHTPAGQGIQEDRKSGHKGFSFTGGHFSNFTLMQCNSAYKLNIIVDHIPLYLVTPGYPPVLPVGFIALDLNTVSHGGKVTIKISCRNLDLFTLLKAPGSVFNNGKGFR